MRIRPLGRYDIAKYPQAQFARYHQSKVLQHVKNGAALALFTTLFQSCTNDGGDLIGVPPPPDLITEHVAREKIVDAFSRNSISLESDVDVLFAISDTLNQSFTLDGYNDSLSVGYEYISVDDPDLTNYSYQIREAINDTTDNKHILLLDDYFEEGYESLLDTLTQDFIDDLRARGIL
jgi:hypothetical protein